MSDSAKTTMTRDEFKELLLRLCPTIGPLSERNLGKAAESTALHCFIYGYVNAGDVKFLKDILRKYENTGILALKNSTR